MRDIPGQLVLAWPSEAVTDEDHGYDARYDNPPGLSWGEEVVLQYMDDFIEAQVCPMVSAYMADSRGMCNGCNLDSEEHPHVNGLKLCIRMEHHKCFPAEIMEAMK